jgi:hypothetical protein
VKIVWAGYFDERQFKQKTADVNGDELDGWRMKMNGKMRMLKLKWTDRN